MEDFFNEIRRKISENPEFVFDYLRSDDLGIKLYSVILFVENTRNKQPERQTLLDFLSIISHEYLPYLLANNGPQFDEALARTLDALAELFEKYDEKGLLERIIPQIIECAKHRVPKVSASALKFLGEFPDIFESNDRKNILDIFSKALESDIAKIRISAIEGIEAVSINNSKIREYFIPPIQGLLGDSDSEVRLSAVGFFLTIAKSAKENISFMLPLLRELRENDPDTAVRERASALIQQISNLL